MSLFIDVKYATLLSAQLKQFKRFKANFFKFEHSCESDSRKPKPRGYLFPAGDGLNMYCHHCGMSHKFGTFLRELDPGLYKEYKMDKFKEGYAGKSTITQMVRETNLQIIQTEESVPVQESTDLVMLDTLPTDHPVLKYAKSRAIPDTVLKDVGFAPDFNKFAAKYEDSFKEKTKKYPRLVFISYDFDLSIIAYNCRAFGKESPKYIKLVVDPTKPQIYGLWRIDTTKDIFVTEGQIDSLMLDNAIAVGGADYSSDFIKTHKDKLIIVPDADFRRNRHVYKLLEKAIDSGYRIALLPKDVPFKDLNDCVVKGGMTREEITKLLKQNTMQGLRARLEITSRKMF